MQPHSFVLKIKVTGDGLGGRGRRKETSISSVHLGSSVSDFLCVGGYSLNFPIKRQTLKISRVFFNSELTSPIVIASCT